MSHTNSTPNYSLPQFITTDKPAWLTDINGAFSAIDTGIDAAKDAADAAQGDATQAASDASDALTAASAADSKGSGAVASIANTFDATSTYGLNDLVMYNSLLYKCTTAVTTPGPWTGSTNWTRTTVENQLDLANSSITTKMNKAVTTDLQGSTITIQRCGSFVLVGLVGCPVSAIISNLSSYAITTHFRAVCYDITARKICLVNVGDDGVKVLDDQNVNYDATSSNQISGGFVFMSAN